MMNLRSMVPALIAGTLFFTALAPAGASTTIKAYTKIRAVLAQGVDSSKLRAGDEFKFVVDDPSQPALINAKIHGHVTEVTPAQGLKRARIGFILDYIVFHKGTKSPIHGHVLAKSVTSTNTAVARSEAVKFSLPAMPQGTRTPGPSFAVVTFSPGQAPSVLPTVTGNSGGYLYAENSNETIFVPPGTPVTIQLTSDLTIP